MPHIAANIRAGREPLNILVGKLPHPDPVRARRACGINNESVCSAGLAERSAKLDQRSIVCENIIFFIVPGLRNSRKPAIDERNEEQAADREYERFFHARVSGRA